MSVQGSGRPPSAGQMELAKATAEHWRKVGNEAPVQAIARAEDAAKQLVALTGTLQGLYFAVFAFSDLRQRVSNPFVQLVFFLPLLLWLASLFCATRVFLPKEQPRADLDDARVNAWQDLHDEYFKVGQQKLAWLHWAHRLLVASFVAVLLLLGALVFIPAASEAGPTRIMIVTPTPIAPGAPATVQP